ncbi:hypothetical protein OB920_13250 [Halobacteria archaeon HArc-gm2]|nr:hypothetical protein [Halobacteria archaeon HArc-gm2]
MTDWKDCPECGAQTEVSPGMFDGVNEVAVNHCANCGYDFDGGDDE